MVLRTGALALVLTLMLAQSPASSWPLIRLSLYAPEQKDSPVQIADFEHDESELQFVLSNRSDKSVVAVVIVRIDVVPRGCTTEPEPGTEPFRFVKGVHPGGFRVSITPHGTSMAAREGIYMVGTPPPGARYLHWPKSMVKSAKSAGASYVQSQFGITAVLFEDGTTWPGGNQFHLRRDFDASKVRRPESPEEDAKLQAVVHPGLFDPSLVEAEAGKCTDVAKVASALQTTKEIIFGHETAQAPNADDKSLPAHLRFSCSLVGEKAICRMPREKGFRVAVRASRH